MSKPVRLARSHLLLTPTEFFTFAGLDVKIFRMTRAEELNALGKDKYDGQCFGSPMLMSYLTEIPVGQIDKVLRVVPCRRLLLEFEK